MTHSDNADFNNLEYIARKLSQGQASAFIGAGFSCNAIKSNPQAPNLPLWRDLGKVFYKHLYGEDMSPEQYEDSKINDPMKLSEKIIATESRADLNQILDDVFSSCSEYKPSKIHENLLLLPWLDVFTTNYDCLLEKANSKLGESKYFVVRQKKALSGRPNHRIIKLHGTLPDYPDLTIAQSDYEQYPKNYSSFVTTIESQLMCNVFCLIGFSGTDPNFLKWIGWVHRELNKNSQPIFLLTHESISDADMKKFEKKNIRIVNVNNLCEDENIIQNNIYSNFDSSLNTKPTEFTYSTRELYSNAINKLTELVEKIKRDSINQQMKMVQWPKEDLLQKLPSGSEMLNCKISDIHEINETLQNIIGSYPHWLVMPSPIRERLSWQLNGLSIILTSKIFRSYSPDILEFLYLYDWVRESCLTPISDEMELPVYERSIPNILSNISLIEDKKKCASILLSMMHTYREDGKKDKWDKVYNDLHKENFSEVMQENGEIYHRFNYECCLQAIFTLEFDKLDDLLSKWKVTSDDLEWALRKAGIMAENNQVHEASVLLHKTLENVSKGLHVEKQNIRLLSLESAIMEFLPYLKFSITLESSNDKLGEKIERDGLHRKYKCSIAEEGQNFEALLSIAPHSFHEVEKEYGFEFGTYSRKFKSGNDELTLRAYAFLRFEELVAIPYRLSLVTHSTDTAKKAALQVSPFSSCLAVATLIRTDSSDIAEKLWTRQRLNLMTVEEADSVCATYYAPFKKIIDTISTEQQSITRCQDISYAHKVLAVILSHFCCKCSLEMRDELFHTVIAFYEKSTDFRSKEMVTLTNRLLNSYSENEIIERVNKINSLPLNDDFDPFSFIETINVPTISTEILDISPLLKECELETSHKKSAEYRLVLLYESKLLTKSQMSAVEKWFSDSYDTLNRKNLIISFSKLKSPLIQQQIEDTLIEKLQSEITRNSFECNSHYWSDLSWAAECSIFSTKNSTLLLSLIQKVILKTLPYFGRHSHFINDGEIARQKLLDLQTTLFWLIVNNPDWNPNEEESKVTNEIITVLQSKDTLDKSLDFIWKLKNNKTAKDRIVDFLSKDLLQGGNNRETGLHTIYLLLGASYHHKEILDADFELKLLLVVSEQIKWRQSDCLFQAINIADNGIMADTKIWGTDIETNLIIGLSYLKDSTIINSDDTIDVVHEKGSLRKISAHLAASMIKHYLKEKKEPPQALSDWKHIIENPNEFSEIRNLKDLY